MPNLNARSCAPIPSRTRRVNERQSLYVLHLLWSHHLLVPSCYLVELPFVYYVPCQHFKMRRHRLHLSQTLSVIRDGACLSLPPPPPPTLLHPFFHLASSPREVRVQGSVAEYAPGAGWDSASCSETCEGKGLRRS